MMRDKNYFIVIGSIKGIYGVRGWVKVLSYTQPRKNILSYQPWCIDRDGTQEMVDLQDLSWQGDRLLVKFTGVETPEDARHYMHHDIKVTRTQLPPLSDHSYYWCDLISMEVINQHNASLGFIERILPTGANDVVLVRGMDQQKTLIPWIKGVYIRRVDQENMRVYVDWQ